MLFNTTIFLLWVYPREQNLYSEKYLSRNVWSKIFKISKNWKQPKCPSTIEYTQSDASTPLRMLLSKKEEEWSIDRCSLNPLCPKKEGRLHGCLINLFLWHSREDKTTAAAKILVILGDWDGRLTPKRTKETFQRHEDSPYADAGGCHMTRRSYWNSWVCVWNGANFPCM